MIVQLQARPLTLWTVRILSGAALSVCLWLYVKKLSGAISSIAGCGGDDGCANVMGGRWSEWFHLPVTLLAALVYAVILILTLPAVQRALGRTGDQLLAAAGVVLGGAAVYFLTLLYAVEKQHCPWCLGLHITGITVATLLILTAGRARQQGSPGILEAALLSGLTAIAILAGGQVWGPKPQSYLITGSARGKAVASAPAATPSGPRPVIYRINGEELKLDAAALPLIGSPSAKFVLVEFFDYTCGACRDLAGDLKALKKKWPDQFAVIVLPTPLNRACNPWVKPTVNDHPGACELAKLALALWRANPAAFAEFHDYLFALKLPASPAQVAAARSKAESLAGTEALAKAIDDPWVSQRLTDNLAVFAKLTAETIAMPKLILHSDVVWHGLKNDTGEFVRLIENEFKPAAGGSR